MSDQIILPIGNMNKQLNKIERYFKDITICPYCGSEKSSWSIGCCGESSCHYQTVWIETDERGRVISDETYSDDELKGMGY